VGGEFFIGVNLGDGSFPFDEEDDEQLREETAFTVMAYTRMQADWGAAPRQFLLGRKSRRPGPAKEAALIVGRS
jgi:hypothetical protein